MIYINRFFEPAEERKSYGGLIKVKHTLVRQEGYAGRRTACSVQIDGSGWRVSIVVEASDR